MNKRSQFISDSTGNLDYIYNPGKQRAQTMGKPGSVLSSLTQLVMETLLPNSCLLCYRQNTELICQACCQRYLQARLGLRCQRCALPLTGPSANLLCMGCLKTAPAFDQTICAFDYAAPQDQLLLAFKFAQQLALAPALAQLLSQAIHAQTPPILPELLSVVPLAPARLAERGYNQAAEIARHLAPSLSLPYYPELIIREKETLPQSHLNFRERKKNVKAAFSPNLSYLELIRGRHIGIVDDVMTTGASLNEIATMLKLHGASQISVFILARTPLLTLSH